MATNLLGEQLDAEQVQNLISEYFRYGRILANIGYLDFHEHDATIARMDNQLKKEYAL